MKLLTVKQIKNGYFKPIKECNCISLKIGVFLFGLIISLGIGISFIDYNFYTFIKFAIFAILIFPISIYFMFCETYIEEN